ncbi:MAG TPA: acyl-CoA dehydrogenase family protein [Methylomirabilota bacterium]|nr:acyl-CoA dehydrogenase family protein [Methylomirabilota bacterium]
MNELQTILGETCTRLFTDHATTAVLEGAERGEWPAALWQALEENGLTLPQVPEARGGAGGSWSDAFVVLMAAGRFAAPVPLAETMLAASILAEAGLDVPMGPMTVAPAHLDEPLALTRQGGGWTLSGRAARVPWGACAEHVVVVADGGGTPTVALVSGGSATAEADASLAREPRDTLVWSGAPVVAAAPLRGRLGARPVWTGGALVRSAQMAGGLEFLLAQSVKYVTERKQFGRPLAAFQAIQQNLALLAGHTAAAAMAAQQAFHVVERTGEGGDPSFEIAVAKVRTGEAAGLGAGIAHQAHGAIGFTYEHSLHFVTRRLWSWRAEFGAESHWSVALGRAVAARGPDALWPHMTAR